MGITASVFLGIFSFAYFKKDEISNLCFGNKDLPDLKNVELRRWSESTTWGGTIPEFGSHIVVPAGKTVLLDINPPELKTLEIAGTLVFADQNIKLSVKNLLLTGVLQIGSPDKPYIYQAEINLVGKESRFLLQGGRFALFGIKDTDQRSPASLYTTWGFANFKNIILKKNETN